MGFRDAWRALWQQKASATGRAVSVRALGKPVWSGRDYAAFADEGYRKNNVAYACINLVARSCASVPLYLMDGDEEVEDHPLLKLLRRPNPFQGGKRLIENLTAFKKISGNAYLEKVNGSDGLPAELYALRPDRMKVQLNAQGYPARYQYSANQVDVWFDVDLIRKIIPILHLKTFHPLDDIYGMSPIEAASYDIDIHNEAKAWNKAMLDNQARPPGALTMAGMPEGQRTLTDEQRAQLKSDLHERLRDKMLAQMPLVLEGGMDWKEMGLSPKDMDFILGQSQSARDICLAFGVPPQILGIPGDNTYSNLKEANSALWRNTIIPEFGNDLDDLTAWFQLVPGWENIRICADWDDVPAIAAERADMWEKITSAQDLTINEKREARGYDILRDPDGNPLPEGEQVLVDASKIPLGTEVPVSGGPAPADDQPTS